MMRMEGTQKVGILSKSWLYEAVMKDKPLVYQLHTTN